MSNPDYVVFILSYKRANNVKTYNTLKRQGYKGRIFIIVGDDDPQINDYKRLYGEQVLVFSKADYRHVDTGDNDPNMNAVLFPRVACFDVAERIGVQYFIQLDDDYLNFKFRFVADYVYREKQIHNLQAVFNAYFEYLIQAKGLKCVALAQGGDYVNGKDTKQRYKRKAMNSFFCDTKRRINFTGKLNEDVCTYVTNGSRGEVYLTLYFASLSQARSQSQEGGLTDIYHDLGTYVKSFYAVMMHPSSITITTSKVIDKTGRRLHHQVPSNTTYPKIVSERLRA